MACNATPAAASSVIINVLFWNDLLQQKDHVDAAQADSIIDHTNYDLIVKRPGSTLGTWEKGLSRADLDAFKGVEKVLTSLEADLAEVEKVTKSGHLYDSLSNTAGIDALQRTVELLGFWGTYFAQLGPIRSEHMARRPADDTPLSINQLSSGDVLRGVRKNPPHVEAYEKMVNDMQPAEVHPPLNVRIHKLADNIAQLESYLKLQDYVSYNYWSKLAVRAANELLADVHLVTRIIDPTLDSLSIDNTDPSADLLYNFRTYFDATAGTRNAACSESSPTPPPPPGLPVLPVLSPIRDN